MKNSDIKEDSLANGDYCQKGVSGCLCKDLYPSERQCPICREDKERDSYCVCPPSDQTFTWAKKVKIVSDGSDVGTQVLFNGEVLPFIKSIKIRDIGLGRPVTAEIVFIGVELDLSNVVSYSKDVKIHR